MPPFKSVLLTSGLLSSLAIAPTLATEGPDPTATPRPVSTPAAIAPAFTALTELTAIDPTATLESPESLELPTPSSSISSPTPTAIVPSPSPVTASFVPVTLPAPFLAERTPALAPPSAATAWAIAQADANFSPETTEQTADQADQSVEQTTQAQDETNPAASPDTSEPVANTGPRWLFSFEPYALIPVSVSGDVTARGRTADVNVDLGDILDHLDLAFFGRFEGWRGPLGFIFDASYNSMSDRSDVSLPLRREGRQLDIDTDVKAQFTRFDLAAGYRFGIKNPEAETEFGLGPVLVDVIGGLRIQSLEQEFELDASLDLRRDLVINRDLEKRRSTTVVEPLLSSRVRWNLSDNLALGLRGDISGFGIEGLTLTWALQGGLDWMFSGNTSLLVGYRVGQLQYSTGSGDDEFGTDLVNHGPYLGMRFRF